MTNAASAMNFALMLSVLVIGDWMRARQMYGLLQLKESQTARRIAHASA